MDSSPADGLTHFLALTQAQRDSAYNNALSVADSAEQVARWECDSAIVRADTQVRLDRRYGGALRNTFDWFPGEAQAPVLVFFHGGYWQTRSKEHFSFVAKGPRSLGMAVAIVGYTLAPQARIGQIAHECTVALDALQAASSELGHSGRVLLAGWSAGAQLAAQLLDHPAVVAALGVSGVYDLRPLRHTYLNAKLDLDEQGAIDNSPLLNLRGGQKPMFVAWGGAELPALRQQSLAFAQARAAAGLPGGHAELRGEDHFSILRALAEPGGALLQIVRAMQ